MTLSSHDHGSDGCLQPVMGLLELEGNWFHGRAVSLAAGSVLLLHSIQRFSKPGILIHFPLSIQVARLCFGTKESTWIMKRKQQWDRQILACSHCGSRPVDTSSHFAFTAAHCSEYRVTPTLQMSLSRFDNTQSGPSSSPSVAHISIVIPVLILLSTFHMDVLNVCSALAHYQLGERIPPVSFPVSSRSYAWKTYSSWGHTSW